MAIRRAVKATSSRSVRTTPTNKAARARRSATATPKRGRRIIATAANDEDAMPMVSGEEMGEGGDESGMLTGAPIPEDGAAQNQRFSSSVDRRIIEGMLHDRDALMAEMTAQGLNTATVVRRAAELGLSEALIRQVKGVAADLAGERPGRKSPPPSLGARTCLCCDRVFLSTGPGNRLCMRCRGGDAGLAQL